MYSVYIHTNKINGKKYVGMTGLQLIARWGKSGQGYSNQPKFYEDILKYGWDNFEHEIVFQSDSKEEAHAKEVELIKQYHTQVDGYNLYSKEEEYKYYQPKLKGVRLIHCIELDQDFTTFIEASKATGADRSAISKVCKGQRESAGKHPQTGEKLHWVLKIVE